MNCKKKYIKPFIYFEDVEQDSAICDVSVYSPDQPMEELGEAKSSAWVDETFADPFAAEVEDATSDFIFNNDLNW